MLEECDIFLPSASEVAVLTEADDDADAVREILAMGVSTVVVKHGAEGATCIDAVREVHGRPFVVDEADPTGAGDCFAAGYLVGWLQGEETEASLRLANACGARAVSVVGPMEGALSRSDLDTWLSTATLRD